MISYNKETQQLEIQNSSPLDSIVNSFAKQHRLSLVVLKQANMLAVPKSEFDNWLKAIQKNNAGKLAILAFACEILLAQMQASNMTFDVNFNSSVIQFYQLQQSQNISKIISSDENQPAGAKAIKFNIDQGDPKIAFLRLKGLIDRRLNGTETPFVDKRGKKEKKYFSDEKIISLIQAATGIKGLQVGDDLVKMLMDSSNYNKNTRIQKIVALVSTIQAIDNAASKIYKGLDAEHSYGKELNSEKLSVSYALAKFAEIANEYNQLGFFSMIWQFITNFSETMQKRAASQLVSELRRIQHNARNSKNQTNGSDWQPTIAKYQKYGTQKQIKGFAKVAYAEPEKNLQRTHAETKFTEALAKLGQFCTTGQMVSEDQYKEFNQEIDKLMEAAVELDPQAPNFSVK